MRTIPLSQGLVALVDDEDFERVSLLKWHAERTKRGQVYAQNTTVKNRYITQVRLHRFIMGCCEGDGMVVDHINGNGLDNRRSNLRVCTQSQNMKNQAKRRTKTSSQFKGVCWDPKRQQWRATIRLPNKHWEIGRSKDEVDAARMYNEAAKTYFGEFARLNDV